MRESKFRHWVWGNVSLLLYTWLATGQGVLPWNRGENEPLKFGKNVRAHPIVGPDTPMPGDPQQMPVGSRLEDFPNPFADADACNRHGRRESFICDPNRLLRRDEADEIEKKLAELRQSAVHHCGSAGKVPFETAIALVHRLPEGVTADHAAGYLLAKWGLGHKECHDGVLLLYAAHPGEVVVRWKSGVEPNLNFYTYEAMKRQLDSDFLVLPLSSALGRAVHVLSLHLSGQIGPARRFSQLVVVGTVALITFCCYLGCTINAIAAQLPSPKTDSSQKALKRQRRAQKKLSMIQAMMRNRALDPNICALTLQDSRKAAHVTFVRSRMGYQYAENSLKAWAARRNIPVEQADPVHADLQSMRFSPAEAKLSIYTSSLEDLPEHLRYIPLRLYLETLLRQYPDLVSPNDVEWWLRNRNEAWTVSHPHAIEE